MIFDKTFYKLAADKRRQPQTLSLRDLRRLKFLSLRD